MRFKTISIIGLGLIGGSIAKALKKSNLKFNISAFDLPSVLKKAISEKTIDRALNSVEESLESDLIFLALPIDNSKTEFKKLIKKLSSETIVSDVCSVKGVFEELWRKNKKEGYYIGGHPMTGKEKSGYPNSDHLLFENSVYIISETAKECKYLEDYLDIIALLGARAIFLDPFLHDKVAASVSHLPQLLSIALVNNAAKKNEEINYLDFAAGGFSDMTRIASSPFDIWRSIISSNKKEVLDSLETFQQELLKLMEMIKANSFDELEKTFDNARYYKGTIPKRTKGFLNPLFDVFVYVKDEPGIISKLSSTLYSNSINIKDIELLKIREGSGGVFRISFESENDAQTAITLFNNLGFECGLPQ